MRRIGTAAALALLPVVAEAHTGAGSTSGFAVGILHPLTGLDHLLAMISVGLIAGFAGGRARWALPLGFVAAMLAGAGLALAGAWLPMVEALIAASVLIFGALTAFRLGRPTEIVLGLVTFFALFHGIAHGQEAPADATILAYLAGFTLATVLLHLAGFALARVLPRAVPVAGAAVLVLGLGIAAGIV